MTKSGYARANKVIVNEKSGYAESTKKRDGV
jgi:hypothetical protein